MTGAGNETGSLIVLTGATGFLGSHIADTLLDRGHRVRASVRATSDRRWIAGKPLEVVELDLADDADCDRLLDGADGVIHCAGVVTARDEAGYRRGNVDTTAALLGAAARRWPAPPADAVPAFVFISSLAAHGPASLARPARETDPSAPITAYGRSKREAEKLVNTAPGLFRRVVLRPPSLYGPRDRDFLPLLRLARAGWTVRLGRSMDGLSLVDGRDAAAAAVDLLGCAAAEGVFFVDDGTGGYDFPGMAAALGEAAGRRVRTIPVPLWPLRLVARIAGWLGPARLPVLNNDRIRDLAAPGWACDGTRLESVTGFRARWPAGPGFTETMRFCREQGWL